MNEEFINVYIEMMNNKISELVKAEIMSQTRLNLAEKIINNMKNELEKTQKAYAELVASVEASKTERTEYFQQPEEKPVKKTKIKNEITLNATNDGGEI
jgi:uncharacterized protein YqgQ